MEFHGKNIVLTGGSSGIGLEMARSLAAEGAEVWNLDTIEPHETLAGVTHISCDIRKSTDIQSALGRTKRSIDMLFSNAGVMRRGSLLESSEDDFDVLFDVNVKGAWMLIKQAWPHLSKEAQIAITASGHALDTPKDPGLYSLSKRTLAALADQLRAHHPEHRVRTLFLGPVDTPLGRYGVSDEALVEKKKIMWDASDISTIVLDFLRSDADALRYNGEKDSYESA